jgi:hypothetical protein
MLHGLGILHFHMSPRAMKCSAERNMARVAARLDDAVWANRSQESYCRQVGHCGDAN